MGTFTSLTNTGAITNLVSSYIGNTAGWANSVFTQATSQLSALGNLTFDVPYEAPELVSVAKPSVNPVKPGDLSVDDIIFTPVEFTEQPPVLPTFDLITHEAPEYVEKDYGINIPGAPVVTWPSFTKTAPSMPDRSIPVVPGIDLPPIPTINDIAIPPPPTYTNPQFTAEIPVDDLTLPTVAFNWGESVYDSNIKTKLGDTLFDNLVSGGSGLDDATEAAIYSRSISRLEEAEQLLIDEVSDDVAQRGFDIPPGALLTLSSEVENKILRSRGDLNKDILIQQSNLAQTNTHFIITHAVQLEGILIQYHDSTQTRALDAAKHATAVVIQLHTLKLETYKSKLGAYQILAQVYGIQVQAEVAKAEFYRTQIEGLKLSVDIQDLYIKAYLSQIEGIKATLEIYKLQMEGANLTAFIDKLKLDGYAIEANAYGIKTRAVTDRFEGYKTELMGEEIKASIYQTDVNAFAAKSSAYNIKTQAEASKAETRLNIVRTEAAIYAQALEKYKVDVGKSVSEAEVKAKIAGLDVAVWSAQSNNYNAELAAAIDVFRGSIEEMRAQSDLSIKSADLAMRAILGEYELTVEVAKGVTAVSGQLAAAAAGAINASLHASSSESVSDSTSDSRSESSSVSTTTADSFIEEHIYSYSN